MAYGQKAEWRDSLRMELIKARADAHAVMPGEREGPPNERAENRLPQGKGKDVALLMEQPGHQGAANQGHGDKDGIGPMEQGEERPGDERNPNGAGQRGEETIGNQRIQGHLLQQTERHVAEEPSGCENVVDRVMRAAEQQSGDGDCDDAGKKDE